MIIRRKGIEKKNLMTDFFKHLFVLGSFFFFMYMMHIPCIDEKVKMIHKMKAA